MKRNRRSVVRCGGQAHLCRELVDAYSYQNVEEIPGSPTTEVRNLVGKLFPIESILSNKIPKEPG